MKRRGFFAALAKAAVIAVACPVILREAVACPTRLAVTIPYWAGWDFGVNHNFSYGEILDMWWEQQDSVYQKWLEITYRLNPVFKDFDPAQCH